MTKPLVSTHFSHSAYILSKKHEFNRLEVHNNYVKILFFFSVVYKVAFVLIIDILKYLCYNVVKYRVFRGG